LPQPKGDVPFLWSDFDNISISKAIYDEIKATVPLSKRADQFLASRIVSDLELKEWACVDWPEKGIDLSSSAKRYTIIENEGCPPLIVLDHTRSMGNAVRIPRILSKAEGSEKVKTQFWNKFSITKEEYEEIKASVPLSGEVDSYLAEHVVGPEEVKLSRSSEQ